MWDFERIERAIADVIRVELILLLGKVQKVKPTLTVAKWILVIGGYRLEKKCAAK
jgi:hypothetical protein